MDDNRKSSTQKQGRRAKTNSFVYSECNWIISVVFRSFNTFLVAIFYTFKHNEKTVYSKVWFKLDFEFLGHMNSWMINHFRKPSGIRNIHSAAYWIKGLPTDGLENEFVDCKCFFTDVPCFFGIPFRISSERSEEKTRTKWEIQELLWPNSHIPKNNLLLLSILDLFLKKN